MKVSVIIGVIFLKVIITLSVVAVFSTIVWALINIFHSVSWFSCFVSFIIIGVIKSFLISNKENS